MQLKLLFILSFLTSFYTVNSVEDVQKALSKKSSDHLPYNVDVLSTAFGSQEYVNIDARIVHAKDDIYAIEFLNQDWNMQVYNANDDYLGLPYFKSKIRRDIVTLLNDTGNEVQVENDTYLGLASYKVKVHLAGANSTSSKLTDRWVEFIVSEEGLLLRYETHSLSGGDENVNKQREVVRFYIQEN